LHVLPTIKKASQTIISQDPTAADVPFQESQTWREQMLKCFCDLFPHRLDTIVRPIDSTGWRSTSRFYSLSDEDIEESVLGNTKLLRAVMPGSHTKFSVISIAAGSDVFSQAGLTAINAALRSIGIVRSSLYRASGSDDWQIFIWWSGLVKVRDLEDLFTNWLEETGLFSPESTSIFPGLRPLPLPLQSGFAWLDEKGEIEVSRESLSLEHAIESFLDDMANDANHWAVVSEQIKNPAEFSLETLSIALEAAAKSEEPEIEELGEIFSEIAHTLSNHPRQDSVAVREIALVQPTCNDDLITVSTCAPTTLWVGAPEVEYSLTFAPDQEDADGEVPGAVASAEPKSDVH